MRNYFYLFSKDDFFKVLFEVINLNTAKAKYNKNGYKRPNAKLEIESFIKIICVFSYTLQKHAIVYQ